MKKEFCGIILRPGCSNNCLFCKKWPKLSERELKIQEVNALKNIISFRKKGYRKIEISGNDPLEYQKIIALTQYLREQGFEFIQLSTHGLQFSEEKVANNISNSYIDLVRVPLYGSEPAIHDSVTQNKGSFKKTTKGIKALKNKKIKIQLTSLLLKQNKNDLINIFQLMNQLGAYDIYFSIPCIINNSEKYYIPYKDQNRYLLPLCNFAKENGLKILFNEVPYCVFGYSSDDINNLAAPPDLGAYNQPEDEHKSHIKDLPTYRVKKKAEICRKCRMNSKCDGFFVNDLNKYGLGELKPL